MGSRSLVVLGVPGVLGGGAAVDWLLLDRFLTARSAGAVDGTAAEPGPGTRTVTDSGNTAAITGGQFVISAIAATRDPWLRYADVPLTRAAGLMLRLDSSMGSYGGSASGQGFLTTLTTPDVGQVLGFGPKSGNQYVIYPANVAIADFTPGDLVTAQIILRSTGFYLLLNGVLHYIYRSGTTGTLYAGAFGRNADADIDYRIDNVGVVQLDTTDPTIFPIPTVSDSFSDGSAPFVSDGLAHVEQSGGDGVTWNLGSSSWSQSGNKAYVDADTTLGAELLTNGDFSAWTGDDPDDWTITSESGGDPEVTERDSGQVHADTKSTGGSANLYSSASGNAPNMSQNIGTNDEFYRIAIVASAANSGIQVIGAGLNLLYGPVTGTLLSTLRRKSAIGVVGRATATDFTIDSMSVKALTWASLLRAVSDNGQPYAAVAMTVTDDTQAGVVINLDSVSNPQNGIRVYLDRCDGSIHAQELISGVWQADSLDVSVTYSAGKRLEVRRIGDSVWVFYNGAYVGSFAASSSNENTLTAIWATDNSSYFENFESYPATGYDYARYA